MISATLNFVVVCGLMGAPRQETLASAPSVDGPELASPRFTDGPADGLGLDEAVTRRDPSDVIKVGSHYYVWYTKTEHGHSGYDATIWYATSVDGKSWTERGEALARGGPGKWDEASVFTPNILVADGSYYLFYTAIPKHDDLDTTPTAIGVAAADSPDGPWTRSPDNPVVTISRNPADFDSFRVDDACLITRNGRYWLYYKGRQHDRSPSETKMGVAMADAPTGPFLKSPHNPVVDSGHEVLVWPHRQGVATLIGWAGPQKNTLQYAPDGIHFVRCSKVSNPPMAPGAYRPDAFRDPRSGQGIQWGIAMKGRPRPHLIRYECNLQVPDPSARGPRPEYIINVDYLDMAWWGRPKDQLYVRPQIAHLLDTARSNGFTRVLWRVSALGKSVYPSKVREMYTGDSRSESVRAAKTLEQIDPLRIGIEECRKRGLEVYAWVTIYDDGGGLPGVTGMESKFSLDHPEYLWCSRDEKDRFAGVLCYAYPEVRAHRLTEFRELLDYNVDGLFLSTRSHSRPNDAEERFGFNEPIVRAYRERYGADIRTEPFDRQKWRDLRGEFLSQFVRETHELCASRGKRLVMGLRAGDEIGWPLGKMSVDWRRWVREGWVSGLCTYALNDVLFEDPGRVREWLGEMSSVTRDRAELWVWVRLFDWSGRFKGRETIPVHEIQNRIRILNEIPSIDAYAFHEALILENDNLWPGLARESLRTMNR